MLISRCGQSFYTCATGPYQFNSSGYATAIGTPCVAKICSNLEIVPFAAVEWTMSTSGNPE